ncbi:MAG: hypothetical protein J7J44_00445, partial [Deltaproteobacteria bacterium]|nr:hypothetical protein [Deltaproteobacteria bacterium]
VGDLVLARDNALNEIVWQIKNINKDRQFLSINAPQGVQVGCLLFRLKDKPNKVAKRRLLDKIINKEKRRNLINWIKKQRIQKKHTKAREFWIHSETLDLFESPRFPFFPILTINDRNYSHLLRRYRQILKRFPNITLSLPPIILPQQLFFFEKAINQLLSLGFKRWFIANLGQFLLFPKGEIFLGTDYTFNVANKLSMKTLEELGANIITTSVELDKGSMRGLPTAMVLVYGRIPVFTSRLNLETFRGKSIVSPLGMECFILSRDQITYVLPQTPFSLTNSLKELKSFGICKFLLDLRFVLTKEGAKVLASILPRGLDSNYKRRGLK